MTIRLLQQVGFWATDEVVDVPDATAKKLIRQGYAVEKRRRGRPRKTPQE